MKCDTCKYLGAVLDHLKGHDGVKEWRHCKYPLPYHADDKAIPMGVKHNCKVHTCGHFNWVCAVYPGSKVCSLYEVYCTDCNNFVNLHTGEIINHKSLVML